MTLHVLKARCFTIDGLRRTALALLPATIKRRQNKISLPQKKPRTGRPLRGLKHTNYVPDKFEWFTRSRHDGC